MNLHFTRRGHGAPLVLLHGLFGSNENLGGVTRVLAEHFDTYAVDLPEHGRSPHNGATGLTQMTEALAQWLQQQGLRQVHLLGHSLGGKVAMELALRHPEWVSGLVVMDIAPSRYAPHHHRVFEALAAVDLAVLESRAAADKLLLPFVPEFAVRGFLLKNLVKDTGGGFAWRMNYPVLARDYPELIAANAERVYPGPVLFLKGGLSNYLSEHQRESILSRFPQAQLKVVANTGHWLHAEKPELVAKLALKFLLELI